MRTTLESGAWIEHVAMGELKGVHRRKLERAGRPSISAGAVSASGDLDIGAMVAGMNVATFSAQKHDALWALIITGWSWELAVPQLEETADGDLAVAGREALDEIPLDDYDEIEELLEGYSRRLNRRPDPKGSITSASNGSSPARAGGSRKG